MKQRQKGGFCILKFFINENNNQFLLRRDYIKVIADSKQFLECELDFPESWNGFYVTACFKKGTVVSTIVNILSKTAFKVPALPLEGEGIMEISFEAVKDGTTVITTNSIPVEVLASGTGGISLPRPTIENPDPYAQYVAIVEAARTEIAALNTVLVTRYTQTIGDGMSNVFEITHNLGSKNVYVSVTANSDPYSSVFCQIDRIDINTVVLSFSENPSINEFTVLIMG